MLRLPQPDHWLTPLTGAWMCSDALPDQEEEQAAEVEHHHALHRNRRQGAVPLKVSDLQPARQCQGRLLPETLRVHRSPHEEG